MQKPPATRIVRIVLTLLCGALPASALLIFVYGFLGQGLFGYLAKLPNLEQDDVLALAFATGLIVFATLGTIGLWRVAIQKEYSGRLNAGLLIAGLIAMSPVILLGLENGPMWFIPLATSKESREALILLGPLYTAIAYLVAMARRRFMPKRVSGEQANEARH